MANRHLDSHVLPIGGHALLGGGHITNPTLEELSFSLSDLNPAFVAAVLGKPEPQKMYLGADAVGAIDLVGADDLIDLSTPVKQVFDPALGGLCTEFNSTSDSMDAVGIGVGDVGAETVTFIWIGRPTALAVRSLFGKRINTGGLNGYELVLNASSGMSWGIDWGASSITRATTVNIGTVNPQVVLCTREFGANRMALYTRDGASEGAGNDVDSLANTQVLSCGSGRTASNNHLFGAVMLWIGTDGNGFGEAERLKIAQGLGYE